MIRINLIGAERRIAGGSGSQRRTGIACVLILIGIASMSSWWQWSLHSDSVRVDVDLVAAEQEMAQLRSGIDEAKVLEQRRTDLRHRVATIQEMRTRPTLPVRLLDHLSRSLPDAVWLTEVQQQNDKLTIEGRAPTLTELSELVGRLGAGPLLLKPIEVASSRLQSGTDSGREPGSVDLLQFSISAQIAEPGSR